MKNFFFVLVVFLSANCISHGQTASTSSVSAIEFKKLVESGIYLLIDIRTQQEFIEGHIQSAINIDFYNMEFVKNISVYKDSPVLIYSRSSSQSKQALNRLAELNFKKVIELENGLVAWKREGLPIVK